MHYKNQVLVLMLFILPCQAIFDLMTLLSLRPLLRPVLSKMETKLIQGTRCKTDFEFWFQSLEDFVASTVTGCDFSDIACYSRKMNLSSREAFAIRQLDSFGRIPSNLLGMTTVSMGSWDECLNVKASDKPSYQTQFCYVRLALHPNITQMFLNTGGFLPFSSSLFQLSTFLAPGAKGTLKIPTNAYESCYTQLAYQWSVCLPRSCSSNEINALLHAINNITDDSVKFCHAMCRSQYGPKKTFTFWLVMSYVSLGFMFVLCSSLYDYCTDVEAYRDFKKTPAMQYFLSFSAYTNGAAILNVEKPKNGIRVLHCMKAITISWVICGHALGLYVVSDNPLTSINLPSNILNDPFINSFFSVDSFFFFGGFLTSFIFFQQVTAVPKRLSSFNYWCRFYLHRLIRIVPAYLLFLGFTVELFDHIRVGPVPLDGMIDIHKCRQHWWYNALFINDIFDRLGACMGHSWYIAADMKFYFLTPLIMLPLYYEPVIAYIISAMLFCISLIANYIAFYKYDFPVNYVGFFANIHDKNQVWKYEQYIYKAPWIRFTPYLIGILAGHIFFVTKNRKFQLHWLLIILLWILNGVIGIGIIYGLYDYFKGPDHQISIFARATYTYFSKIGWSFVLFWVIIACERNWAGPLKNFMEMGIWVPFSRLTYSIYLTHILVLAVTFSMRRHTIRFVSMTHAYIREAIPVYVLSLLLAFFWSCTFEIPFVKIESIICTKIFRKKSFKNQSGAQTTIFPLKLNSVEQIRKGS